MFHKSIVIFYIVSGLFLASCSKEKQPEVSSRFYKEFKDLSYGESASQAIDMVFPDVPENIKKPVNAILFIHGGGWQEGDKDVYADALVDVSKNLYFIAAAMNYRMFGEGANCDDMLADVHSALSLIKSKTNQEGVAINKVILMGASAGAHLSLLYTYKNHAKSPIHIAFCVGQSSPADFTDLNLYTSDAFGDYLLNCVSNLTGKQITIENIQQNTDVLLSVSPIHYINSTIPPTLFAHGSQDMLIPSSNATRLYDALTNEKATCDLFIYSNSGHELDKDPGKDADFYNKMLEYIQLYAE